MINRMLIVFLASISLAFAGEEINISVTSDPALPAPNIISRIKTNNADFSDGLKHWQYSKTSSEGTDITVVENEKQGKAVSIPDSDRFMQLWANIPAKNAEVLVPGKTYIASCRIKPGADLLEKKGQLGFGVVFTSMDGKKILGGIRAYKSGSADKWMDVVGKPFTVPTPPFKVVLGVGLLFGTTGSGLVDSIAIRDAYTKMKIDVTAPEAIRQVKVTQDNGQTVFDSGVLKDESKTFSQEHQVETPHVYTVTVITKDGDVKSVTYPSDANKSEEASKKNSEKSK